MGICVPRVLLGGIVAGIVIDVFEAVINGMLLRNDWAQAMRALGKSAEFSGAQLAVFNVWGLIMGVAAVWVYAAMRPRFGPGPRTATITALTIWVIAYLLSTGPAIAMQIFPARLLLIGVAGGLIEILVATNVGAWLYREQEQPQMRAAGV